MADNEPLGERLARVETLVGTISEDVTEIKDQFADWKMQQAKQDAYARVGKWIWSIAERVLLTVGGAGAMMWLQRHFPGGQ